MPLRSGLSDTVRMALAAEPSPLPRNQAATTAEPPADDGAVSALPLPRTTRVASLALRREAGWPAAACTASARAADSMPTAKVLEVRDMKDSPGEERRDGTTPGPASPDWGTPIVRSG